MHVTLPNRAYLADLERFLRRMVDDGSADFTLELGEGLFSVHPLVLCMLGAMADHAEFSDANTTVTIDKPTSSARYLQRMKLFEAMELPVNMPLVEHDPSGRFIPVTRIQDNAELNRFVLDFVPLLHAKPDEADSVKYVLYELVRNVLEHSASPAGALAAAQVTKKGRLLVAVADSGVGVRKSLSRSHRVDTDRAAVELAFRPGVTGTTSRYGGNDTNGGAGLFFMKAMATVSRHHMVMVTGDTMMKLLTVPSRQTPVIHEDLSSDRVRWIDLDVPFHGTAVGIDITVEETVRFSSLLKEIREVYHVKVKKDNKKRFSPRFT